MTSRTRALSVSERGELYDRVGGKRDAESTAPAKVSSSLIWATHSPRAKDTCQAQNLHNGKYCQLIYHTVLFYPSPSEAPLKVQVQPRVPGDQTLSTCVNNYGSTSGSTGVASHGEMFVNANI